MLFVRDEQRGQLIVGHAKTAAAFYRLPANVDVAHNLRGQQRGWTGGKVSFLAAGQLLSVYFLEFSSLFSFNKSLRFSLFFPSST